MKDIELPPLATSDHPDYPAMAWLPMELSAIYRYARAAVEADRAQRVPEGGKVNPIRIRTANTPPSQKIRGNELTLHLALHVLRNPWPFDQRERDLVRLWAADELERLSVRCMQSNTPMTGGTSGLL